MGPIFFLHLDEIMGNFVQCLIPGDPGPFALSPGSGSFEGILYSVRVVEELYPGVAPGANPWAIGRTLGIALYLYEFPLLHLAHNGAAPETHLANAWGLFCSKASWKGRLCLPGLCVCRLENWPVSQFKGGKCGTCRSRKLQKVTSFHQ